MLIPRYLIIISYGLGIFHILRAKQLEKSNKKIEESKQIGAETLGVGIYEDELCKNIGCSNV